MPDKVVKTVEGPFDLVFLDAEKGNEVHTSIRSFPSSAPAGSSCFTTRFNPRRSCSRILDMVAKHPEIIHVVLSL